MKPLDLLVIGEVIVDLLPCHRGPLREAGRFEVHCGGAPANVAAGVALAGGAVGITSLLGDDEFGRLALTRLGEFGVDCSGVKALPSVQTGLCFIDIDQTGERSFTHRGGDPFSLFKAVHLDMEALERARCIEFSCGALRSEASLMAINAAIDHTDAWVALDPGACPPAWGDPEVVAQRTLNILPRCTIFKCSRDEATALVGSQEPEEAVERLAAKGAELTIVTDGPQGAFYRCEGRAGRVPSPLVPEVVDTTGAGDAFMAGLIRALLLGGVNPGELSHRELTSVLEAACRAGATAVTHLGAVRRPVGLA